MIRRLYVHNFRCLENFELSISGQSSVLLIGKNGSGKTTVSVALELLQKIARGTNRVAELVKPKDFSRGRQEVPMRFEVGVDLHGGAYEYTLAFQLSKGSRELSVLEEKLLVDGSPIYIRTEPAGRSYAKSARSRVGKSTPTSSTGGPRDSLALALSGAQGEPAFPIDWHLVALPILQELSTNDPLCIFKRWLAHMLILRPIPALIVGDSTQQNLLPAPWVVDFGAWFSGLVADHPRAYSKIEEYLKQVMPDLNEIQNPLIGKDSRSLVVQFSADQAGFALPFQDLSDGEKCFMICALVLAANESYGPLVCFWDEPDNYLALDEVGHFVMSLRKAFRSGGQFIATSHNPEAIRGFSDENTLLLYRRNHFEPTIVRPISQLRATGEISGDLISALIRGDVEP